MNTQNLLPIALVSLTLCLPVESHASGVACEAVEAMRGTYRLLGTPNYDCAEIIEIRSTDGCRLGLNETVVERGGGPTSQSVPLFELLEPGRHRTSGGSRLTRNYISAGNENGQPYLQVHTRERYTGGDGHSYLRFSRTRATFRLTQTETAEGTGLTFSFSARFRALREIGCSGSEWFPRDSEQYECHYRKQ